MTKALPERPSIRSLRYEAKQILKAHRTRDSSALATLRHHAKFSHATDQQLRSARVTLQDAQHAMAREYGFAGWADLLVHIDPDRRLERFTRLQASAHQLLSDYWSGHTDAIARVDQALADDAVQQRLPPNGSDRLRWLDDALEIIAHEQGAVSWAALRFGEINASALRITPADSFAVAVRENDLATVRRLLRAEESYANARLVGSPFRFDGTGWLPGNDRAPLPEDDPRTCMALHFAAVTRGGAALASLLIEYGADVDAPSFEGSPLDLAAWEGDLQTLSALLAAGADPSGVGRHTSGPLYTALEHSSPDKARALLEFGAPHTIHTAAMSGDNGALAQLIRQGSVPLELRSGRNRTALQEAAFYGQEDSAEILIRAGAQISAEVAVGLGMRAQIARILDEDADALSRLYGTQPLICWATTAGQPEVIDDLIARGADPNQGDQWGVTPVRFAKSTTVIERLVAGGADVNLDSRGFTPLADKMWQGPLEAAKTLVQLGADINQKCSWMGHTPCHKAVLADPFDPAALSWLIDQGADLRVADDEGLTPLDYAKRDGLKAAEMLLADA